MAALTRVDAVPSWAGLGNAVQFQQYVSIKVQYTFNFDVIFMLKKERKKTLNYLFSFFLSSTDSEQLTPWRQVASPGLGVLKPCALLRSSYTTLNPAPNATPRAIFFLRFASKLLFRPTIWCSHSSSVVTDPLCFDGGTRQ